MSLLLYTRHGFANTISYLRAQVLDSHTREWLRKHQLIHDHKVDIKPNTLRFRQAGPGKFKRFAIKKVKLSVEFVIGFL